MGMQRPCSTNSSSSSQQWDSVEVSAGCFEMFMIFMRQWTHTHTQTHNYKGNMQWIFVLNSNIPIIWAGKSATNRWTVREEAWFRVRILRFRFDLDQSVIQQPFSEQNRDRTHPNMKWSALSDSARRGASKSNRWIITLACPQINKFP